MLNAGDLAPQFSLADLAGNPRTLAAILEHGPALLVFYKISCPVCRLTVPYLERLRGGALQIVAISQDDERGTRLFMQMLSITLPMLLDPEEDNYSVSNAFGITHVPSLFLVETDRRITLATHGFSKRDLEAIAQRAESRIFLPEDSVPEWKAG